jgi:hypothetical protein
MSTLPQWKCRNEHEAKAMTDWVNDQLDQIEIVSERFSRYGETVLSEDDKYLIEQAIEQADKGDIEPLRRLFPHLARFMCRPPRERGKRFPKNTEDDPVRRAAADVKLIRALWAKHYGKKNRPPNDRVTAVQIAADRWGVNDVTLTNRMNKASTK